MEPLNVLEAPLPPESGLLRPDGFRRAELQVGPRTPEGERELRRGDLTAFREGVDGAHDIASRTQEPVRVLMISTKRSPAVAVYPESDKLALWRIGDDGLLVSRSAGVDYWEGEAP